MNYNYPLNLSSLKRLKMLVLSKDFNCPIDLSELKQLKYLEFELIEQILIFRIR